VSKFADGNARVCYVAGVLGIPFLDVVRVLAAVLLLGNLQFHDNNGTCETHEAELKAVSGLLGVTPASLLRGLTMRTHNVRGQLVKSMCDANMVGKFPSGSMNHLIHMQMRP
jgi:myosin heavy subunit